VRPDGHGGRSGLGAAVGACVAGQVGSALRQSVGWQMDGWDATGGGHAVGTEDFIYAVR